MPKKGTTRRLPKDLRAELAYNIKVFMTNTFDLKTPRELGERTSLGRRTIERYLKKESPAGVDELQVIGEALGVDPWRLLCPRPAAAQLEEQRHERERLIPRGKQIRHEREAKKIRR